VEYFHPDDLTKVVSFLAEYKTTAGKAPREIEYRIKHACGEWVYILDRYRVFKRNDQALPVQIMGVARDITERKRAEAEIECKNKQLQEATRKWPPPRRNSASQRDAFPNEPAAGGAGSRPYPGTGC
jgi:predicted AAA+ superfamily ATPase